jgi:hypothetical protein
MLRRGLVACFGRCELEKGSPAPRSDRALQWGGWVVGCLAAGGGGEGWRVGRVTGRNATSGAKGQRTIIRRPRG